MKPGRLERCTYYRNQCRLVLALALIAAGDSAFHGVTFSLFLFMLREPSQT